MREFAAAALARMSPDTFAGMVPELLGSSDPVIRRLALQLGPPERITREQLAAARNDENGWVRAAAAVAGMTVPEPGDGLDGLLAGLRDAPDPQDRAAAVWAAAFLADEGAIARGMRDADREVRLEAIRSFARRKGEVKEIAEALIACLRDDDVEVRREALRQVVRWTPPADWTRRFSEALADGLASGGRDVRLLASEAMSTQAPEALYPVLPMLPARGETPFAATQALVRGGEPELSHRARGHHAKQRCHGAPL